MGAEGRCQRMASPRSLCLQGCTTAANVLSIKVMAVWKGNAYLFTGDAHWKDVTSAAQDLTIIIWSSSSTWMCHITDQQVPTLGMSIRKTVGLHAFLQSTT